MIKATAQINGNTYTLPMSYDDITLGKFKAIQDFLYSEHNKELTEQITEGKVVDEESILNYMVDVLNYVTGIPTKELKQVRRFTKDDDIGIEDLFYSFTWVYTVPQIDNPKPAYTIGRYHFIDKFDLTQAVLKDLNFIEYTEANTVIRLFNEMKEGRYDNLNLLLGIMYRPMVRENWYRKPKIEEYDSEKVKERAKEFNEVKMSTVWNCLFFFTQLRTELLKSTAKSLEEEVEKVRQG